MNEPIWLDVEILIDASMPSSLRCSADRTVFATRACWNLRWTVRSTNVTMSETDLAALAAAYAFGIARNHPFVDGNKRTAFGAMIVFLGLNDIDFVVPPESARP